MTWQVGRRRALVAAANADRPPLCQLFTAPCLANWDLVEADCSERARLLHELGPCDVIVADGGLSSDLADLTWLQGPRPAPVLYLADARPEVVREALRHGADSWLPRSVVLDHPDLFAACLERLADNGEVRRRSMAATRALSESRRQVDRLANLLWEAVPGEGPSRWLSQRHVLERCAEEVARSQRHGSPLTIVLGEIGPTGPAQQTTQEADRVAAWAASRLGQAKRRCDVAGRYGLSGFLLVLPHTGADGALRCCQRLRDVLLYSPGEAGPSAPLSAWFGVAAYSPETASVKALLRRAEEHLGQARAEDSQSG